MNPILPIASFGAILVTFLCISAAGAPGSFVFNVFNDESAANLSLSGVATVPNADDMPGEMPSSSPAHPPDYCPPSALVLTNGGMNQIGHAFYSVPIRFVPEGATSALSFSTKFIFHIECATRCCGHGFAFALSPTRDIPSSEPAKYLGLFNPSNDGNATNRVVAVEFDTHRDADLGDTYDEHVGIDLNSVRSRFSTQADFGVEMPFNRSSLKRGEQREVWIEYDGPRKELQVFIWSNATVLSRMKSLLSVSVDLASYIAEETFIGFTASTGRKFTGNHTIVAWSFALNGTAAPLEPGSVHSRAPPDPITPTPAAGRRFPLVAAVSSVSAAALLILLSGVGLLSFILTRRRQRYNEILEDWENEYGPHSRFSFKDLYKATGGFKDDNLLGAGGFGKVYYGVLPVCGTEVAVKRVWHENPKGIKEFVAEIVSMRQLRHRNLVQLLGYCRLKGELLLVYEYMPKGSLDGYLFHDITGANNEGEKPKAALNWTQRFDIIKGVASALLYLHEGSEQVVVHRDIKAGNVLLDNDYNGKLGDFGLARLYDRGANPRTTHVVGTLGYLAPELSVTGKATTSTDVYAFGAYLLEVSCGRRPMEVGEPDAGRGAVLADWVLSRWKKGDILCVADPRLGGDYEAKDMNLVLQLGLLCCQLDQSLRPNMRQVVQFLEGATVMPKLSPDSLSVVATVLENESKGVTHTQMSYPSTFYSSSTYQSDVVPSTEKEMSCLLTVEIPNQPR